MAVNGAPAAPSATGAGPDPAPKPMPVLRHFASLRLRILANGFRGRPSRVALFVLGVFSALYLAGMGFLGFAASAAGDPGVRLMVAAYGGATLVIGSILGPLIWFGVDESLDPARLALLPLPRRQLVAGLLVGALLGVPAAALLAATTGLLVPAIRHGGALAGLGQAVGLLAGLLLCVTAARAVTSAFATMLRSRRARDLAGILLASIAALIAPLQFAVFSAARNADWDRLTEVAEVIGWTPLGAAYTVGHDLAEGAPLAAVGKLLITAAAIGGLLWWWSRSIESAMVGATASGPSRGGRVPSGGPVRMLFPRAVPGLRVSAAGAMVARELRYWWRDPKRRASLIMVAVMGAFLPMMVMLGGQIRFEGADEAKVISWSTSPTALYLTALFVGAFAASLLANQFGLEGTAYSYHLIAGVPGRQELLTRAVAYSHLPGAGAVPDRGGGGGGAGRRRGGPRGLGPVAGRLRRRAGGEHVRVDLRGLPDAGELQSVRGQHRQRVRQEPARPRRAGRGVRGGDPGADPGGVPGGGGLACGGAPGGAGVWRGGGLARLATSPATCSSGGHPRCSPR